MKNKDTLKNKKTNKQIYTKFVLMVVVGCVVGVIIGLGGAFISDMYGGDIVGGLHQTFEKVIPVMYVAMMLGVYSYSFFQYHKAKKMVTNWDGIHEEILDQVDGTLSKAMIPNNIMMVCNFFFYSALTYISGVKIPKIEENFGIKEEFPFLAIAVALFVFNMVVITIIQKLTVDLTKKINPEKRGNILDSEFNKDWLASCDEAEKQKIFEAGYRAYQAANNACMVMWLLTLIGIMLFDIGIMPSVCVFVIWLTMVIAYTIACQKLEHK